MIKGYYYLETRRIAEPRTCLIILFGILVQFSSRISKGTYFEWLFDLFLGEARFQDFLPRKAKNKWIGANITYLA
jgi:hypothetical protein